MKYLKDMLNICIAQGGSSPTVLYLWQYISEANHTDREVTSVLTGKPVTRNVRWYMRFLFEHRAIRNMTAHNPDVAISWLDSIEKTHTIVAKDEQKGVVLKIADVLTEMLYYAYECEPEIFDTMCEFVSVVADKWKPRGSSSSQLSVHKLSVLLQVLGNSPNHWEDVRYPDISPLYDKTEVICNVLVSLHNLNSESRNQLVKGLIYYKSWLYRERKKKNEC